MSFSEFLKGQIFVLIQWLYAIWQIARDTTFVNSVYYLCQMAINGQLKFVFRSNTNVQLDHCDVPYTVMDINMQPDVIHISKKYSLRKTYSRSWEDFRSEYFDNVNNRNINGVELVAFNQWWYTVKFNGSYYFCHQNVLFEWAMYDIDKLILLKEVELIGNELVMGTVISKEEMFEAMLSWEYHINELYAPCIFGKEYNVTWNLRLSAFLATIPLLLQARGLANESALCTLILLLVDIVRTPLLQLYDLFMFYLTKQVKLRIFGKCKQPYIFFSWFSKRWAACDRRYGYAYYTTSENESVFPVTTFVKFKDLDDCQFAGVYRRDTPCIESFGFQINNRLIHSAELGYGNHCLYIKVKEGFFVSCTEALSIMKYNQYSKLEPHREVLAKVFNTRCNMRKIIMWGLVKMLEIQIVKTGVATLRKILRQKQEESTVDNLLQTASNRGGEPDTMNGWRKKLPATQLSSISVPKEEIRNVLETFLGIPELPARNIRAYIISIIATTSAKVSVVDLLQGEYPVRKPVIFVSVLEKTGNVATALAILFSSSWYRNRIDGKKKVMIGYFSDSGEDAGRFSASWQLYKAQEDLRQVAKNYSVRLTMFHGHGAAVGRVGSPAHLVILMCPETIHGSSLQVTVQGGVTEQSFGEEHLCLRTLQKSTVASSLEHQKHPRSSILWRELMVEMTIFGTNKEYRSIVSDNIQMFCRKLQNCSMVGHCLTPSHPMDIWFDTKSNTSGSNSKTSRL